MSCIQVNYCQLPLAPYRAPTPKAEKRVSLYFGTKLPQVLKLTCAVSRRHSAPVCLFGGKGKSENGNEESPWKAIEKAMGNFKKDQSVEDLLRQQIQKQEFYNDGDNGGDGPGGGRGGGGGDGFSGAENEDGSGMWEEFGEVILATCGFIFLYIYIINSEEINVFTKDALRFLFTRRRSIRLNRLIVRWKRFLRKMTEEEEYDDPYALQRAILNTTTDYDSPAKYMYLIESQYGRANSQPPSGPSDFNPLSDSNPPSDYED